MNQAVVTDEQRIQMIRRDIMAEGQRLRRAYPLLQHQSAIGFAIFLFAVSGVVVSGFAYIQGWISAWVCVPLVAVLTSLLHELEHDLIHYQYFKQHRWVQNLMLLVGWLLRPGTINPWVRRQLHLLHHKVSGTDKDIEERGISNGMAYSPLRFWVMLDTFVGNLVKVWLIGEKDSKIKRTLQIVAANFPFGVACALIWYGFLFFHGMSALSGWFDFQWVWSTQTIDAMEWVNTLVVVLVGPFYLRSFCLNFISSNMHYYGGVTNLLHQTQVLNHLLFLPFQLFCFNFGSTHGIHHFVVKEPFYLRQMTAPFAHQVMKQHGVRFNDLGTFKRANHYAVANA